MRQIDKERKVVRLEGKEVPRNAEGDPCFLQLGEFLKPEERDPKGDLMPPTVLDLFTPDEVVTLVNRQLYSMEYQRRIHRDRAKLESERLGPIKKKVREMFGTSYLKATEEQVAQAVKAVLADKQPPEEEVK